MPTSPQSGRPLELVRAAFVGPVTSADRAAVARAHGTVTAVYRPGRGAFVGDHPIVPSLDEAIELADVVHINVRADAAQEALDRVVRAGRPAVLSTIPAPSTLRDVIAFAAGARALVAMPYVRRFYPMVRLARRRVRSGAVGPIQLIRGSVLVASSADTAPFAELGASWCDLMEFVSGHRVERISAAAVTSPHGKPRNDAIVLVFTTDRGAAGSFVLSRLTPGAKGELRIEVDGVEESITFDERRPEVLDVASARSLQRVQRGGEVSRYSPLPAGHPQGFGECWDAYIGDVYAAVRGGRPEGLPTIADLARSQDLADAVVLSLDTSEWAPVAGQPTETRHPSPV